MKISLTVDLDCRHSFVKEGGQPFAFPGQDFTPAGDLTESKKCREIYVGPNIVDKLECEPEPPSESSYSPTSEGRSPSIEPPSDSSIIIIPPEPGCTCDIRARPIGFSPGLASMMVEVVNFGTCEINFDVTSEDPNVKITPNNGIFLGVGETVILNLVSLTTEFISPVEIAITTDVCDEYTVTVGTVPPEA